MTLQLISNDVLEFRANSLEEVRKEYGLDQRGMEQALDIIQEWIKKQDHFVKKDFRRDYLERVIISSKGSVEKAKIRLDKMCTMRTMVPVLFEKCDAKHDFPNLGYSYMNINMPKLSDDNYRLFIARVQGKITSTILMEAYQWSVIMCEYLRVTDYSNGLEGIIDVRDVNIMDLITNINLVDLRNTVALYTEGYGFRIKRINILSNSKVIDTLVGLLKQVFTAKIGQRIHVVKDIKDFQERFPKKMLPKDYGGDEKSISEIYDKWNEVLSLKQNVKYIEEMKGACTIEKYRRSDKLNEDYLGMPGSFKILTVD